MICKTCNNDYLEEEGFCNFCGGGINVSATKDNPIVELKINKKKNQSKWKAVKRVIKTILIIVLITIVIPFIFSEQLIALGNPHIRAIIRLNPLYIIKTFLSVNEGTTIFDALYYLPKIFIRDFFE